MRDPRRSFTGCPLGPAQLGVYRSAWRIPTQGFDRLANAYPTLSPLCRAPGLERGLLPHTRPSGGSGAVSGPWTRRQIHAASMTHHEYAPELGSPDRRCSGWHRWRTFSMWLFCGNRGGNTWEMAGMTKAAGNNCYIAHKCSGFCVQIGTPAAGIAYDFGRKLRKRQNFLGPAVENSRCHTT